MTSLCSLACVISACSGTGGRPPFDFGPCANSPAVPANPETEALNWDVIANGVDQCWVADPDGHVGNAFDRIEPLPEVDSNPAGHLFIQVFTPVYRNYSFLMHVADTLGHLQIQKEGLTARLSVVQYNDLPLSTGVWMSFALCTDGPSDLRISGAIVPPTASATGPAAADVDGPDVQISSDKGLVTIGATDPSGVLAVMYWIDNEEATHPYVGPFAVPCGRDVTVNAMADDKIGNRSAPRTMTIRC